MRSIYIRLLICILGLLVCTYAAGQDLPGMPTALKTEAAIPTDPLGRDTPNGCFFGFLKAVRLGKYQTATQYLQLSPSRQQSQSEQLSIKLQSVLGHGLIDSLPDLSTNPKGTLQEGVPHDRERVGRVLVNNSEVNVDLVRVSDSDAGNIWLF